MRGHQAPAPVDGLGNAAARRELFVNRGNAT